MGITSHDGLQRKAVTQNVADDNIASGTDWVLGKDGVLTIESDDGMRDWRQNGRCTYKSQVKQAVLKNSVTSIGLQAELLY